VSMENAAQDDGLASKELELYNKLAAAIGDTLEAVCNMQERERSELITVLGLVSSEETVKIIRSGEDQDQESELGGIAHVNSNEGNSSDRQGTSEQGDGIGNFNRLDDLDDDLKVVAVKKRKRSLSGDMNNERKRKTSADFNFSKGDKADFSKYLESKNGNISQQTGNLSDVSSTSGKSNFIKYFEKKNGESKASPRKSVDISKHDFERFLETDDGDIFKDVGNKKIDTVDQLEEALETKQDDLGTCDESMSLLGEPSKPGSLSAMKDVEDASDDEEPTNQLVGDQNSAEILKEIKDASENIIDQKLLEVSKILTSRFNLVSQENNSLHKIFDRGILDPKQVLEQDNLPVFTSGAGEASNAMKLAEDATENVKNLMKYYQAIQSIKSQGLYHGVPEGEVSWTPLLPKRSTRGKSQEKGIVMKFVASTEDSSEKGIIYEDSSDEFEVEKNSCLEVNEKISNFDLLKPQTRWSTPKQPQATGWMSKPSSSAKSEQTSSVNRLRLPKGKRKLQLISTENSSEVKAESDLQILPSTEVTPGNSQSQEEDATKEQNQDISVSDDDSIEIVLEVASNENTPSKTRMTSQDAAGTRPDSPVLESISPKTGCCPMCGRKMTIPMLMKHCETCEGPEQGPSLRNTGGRGRRTY